MLIAFDLDDTLFSEIDYVRSSYRAIAREYGADLLPLMMRAPTPAAAFDAIPVPIADALSIYRNHIPDIRLSREVEQALDFLKGEGHTLAIITDGRSVTQRHKIEALGLERFVDADHILISEEIGAEKLSGVPFRMLERLHPDEKCRIYVGDNPAKDFAAANKSGWHTVCLLDSGNNIHKQHFDAVDEKFLPIDPIRNFAELIDLVKQTAIKNC